MCNWIIVSRCAQNKDVFKTHADHSSINIILIKLLWIRVICLPIEAHSINIYAVNLKIIIDHIINGINVTYKIYYFSGEWHAGGNLMIFIILVNWKGPRFQCLKQWILRKVSVKLLLMMRFKAWIINVLWKFYISHTAT